MSVAVPATAQRGTEGGQWRHYAGDSGSTKYSPMDQIDAGNFSQLEIVWSWESADALLMDKTDLVAGPYRGTPLMIDGVVYHGVWDYDLASAPNLIDITVDGKDIKAVAVVSKAGMTYVFDRATGEPE